MKLGSWHLTIMLRIGRTVSRGENGVAKKKQVTVPMLTKSTLCP